MLNTRASESSGEVDALLDGRHPAGRTPPPLPTVALTRVPTVHSLPPSLLLPLPVSLLYTHSLPRKTVCLSAAVASAAREGVRVRRAAPDATRLRAHLAVRSAISRFSAVILLARSCAPPPPQHAGPPVLRPLRRRKGCCVPCAAARGAAERPGGLQTRDFPLSPSGARPHPPRAGAAGDAPWGRSASRPARRACRLHGRA